MKYSISKNIDNAIGGISKLDPEVLKLKGMSSSRNRHLLNNILEAPNINYLEIGVWHGSTFISALYKNKVRAYAIDNWSEYNDNESKYNFYKNCERFGISGYTFFETDSFKVDLNWILNKINVYFYDGDHNYLKTIKALTYFLPVLDNEFLFIVDDYDWKDVNKGVMDGIKECKLRVIQKWELHSKCANDKDTWWNGLGIFILRK